MRDAFVEGLIELAAADPSVVLMTGDLGFGVLKEYQSRFGSQFINVGVAEQNLAGVAAGMALVGHRVFVYSIANFPTLRCLEQIRNDVCYHDASVTVVAVGGGMAYGSLGPSHFATEDIAIMRSLPNMKVVAPGDPHEVRALMPQLAALGGPSYLRLGRAGEPDVHSPDTDVVFGKPSVVRVGERVCVLTTGGMLSVAVRAVDSLTSRGCLRPTLVSMHTLTSFDEDALAASWEGHDVVVTCEEHSVVGGLGSLVAELLAERADRPRLVRIGLPRAFPSEVGSQEYLRTAYAMDAASLERRFCEAAEAAPRRP